MVPYIALFDDCANKRKFDVLEKVHFIQTVLLDLKSNVLFIVNRISSSLKKLCSFPGNGSKSQFLDIQGLDLSIPYHRIANYQTHKHCPLNTRA